MVWGRDKARDASARINYSKKIGAIFYKPDEHRSADHAKFAALCKDPKVTHQSFPAI